MMVTGRLAKDGFHDLNAPPLTHTGLRVQHVWVIVADREQAYIYRKTPDGLELLAHATAKGKQMESVDDHIFSPQSMQLRPPLTRTMKNIIISTSNLSVASWNGWKLPRRKTLLTSW